MISLFRQVFPLVLILGFSATIRADNDNIRPLAQPTPAVSGVCQQDATAQPPVFADDRYIELDQIQPGMHGYGLTVFRGTEVERFDVEVVSVMRNYDPSHPNRDAILVRCRDERFDLARGVQGVSGSPVYFDNKIAGAMAFGWSFSEEPLYGVTPIREMLETSRQRKTIDNPARKSSTSGILPRQTYNNLMRRELLSPPEVELLLAQSGLTRTARHHAYANGSSLSALPMPIMVGSFNAAALEQTHKYLPGLALQQGWGSGTGSISQQAGVELKPGSTVTIPLVMGDMNVFALGTATEVIGDKVYMFGHGWNEEGAAHWPMGTGFIHTFVSRKDISFKLGQFLQVVGAIRADEVAGLYGQVGASADLVPMRVKINWAETADSQTFDVQIAQDERADPILATLVLIKTMLQRGSLPRKHTIDYRLNIEFDQLEPIVFENTSSTHELRDIVADTFFPIGLVLNNPWLPIKLTRLEAQVTIKPKDSICLIKSARLAQRTFAPSETVKVQLVLETLRGPEQIVELSLKLPSQIEEGNYNIAVGAYQNYQQQLRAAGPHRYQAFDAADVRRILQERLTIKRNRIYITLVLPEEGLAIEGRELPDLPGSRAMLLTDKSRQMTTHRFRPLIANSITTDYEVLGKTTFDIEVKKYPQ